MCDILKIIEDRHSARIPFNLNRPVPKQDLLKILEAARWAPTAHNMQNFEIIVVDDKGQLEKLGNIESRISEDFLRENYQQLSFSEEELARKKTGILGTSFPQSWVTPGDWSRIASEIEPLMLDQTIRGGPVVLIVIYDSTKRAPASEGDVLGFISLGCVMENMWIMAQALGLEFHVMSVFSGESVEHEVKKILEIPEFMKIAYAVRLGYTLSKLSRRPRVRRDVVELAHHNRFGNKNLP